RRINGGLQSPDTLQFPARPLHVREVLRTSRRPSAGGTQESCMPRVRRRVRGDQQVFRLLGGLVPRQPRARPRVRRSAPALYEPRAGDGAAPVGEEQVTYADTAGDVEQGREVCPLRLIRDVRVLSRGAETRRSTSDRAWHPCERQRARLGGVRRGSQDG